MQKYNKKYIEKTMEVLSKEGELNINLQSYAAQSHLCGKLIRAHSELYAECAMDLVNTIYQIELARIKINKLEQQQDEIFEKAIAGCENAELKERLFDYCFNEFGSLKDLSKLISDSQFS